MVILHQTLPDEIIMKILSIADSVVIGRSITLSKFWNDALQTRVRAPPYDVPNTEAQWSSVVACRGNLSTMDNKYCSNLGTIYWIKFPSDHSNSAESVLAYSVTLDQFNNYIIPHRHRGGKHALIKLIKYKGNMCLANTVNDNGKQHTITLWTVSSVVDQTFRWKAALKISNLRRYDNHCFFIDSDLVRVTDDCHNTSEKLDAIILSRFQSNQRFARHHILCGGWGHQIVASTYPV
ncbi:hypothetical protein PIB30_022167 [Stylosanthes scabra]|uniref:F-box domain-containing protein n=1 Tax=Stylosanthes scabra TaxID=79078 RepID=A0ABU6W7H6_9FABA|nr:hypothetical protein [Stylosanthes scabra]